MYTAISKKCYQKKSKKPLSQARNLTWVVQFGLLWQKPHSSSCWCIIQTTSSVKKEVLIQIQFHPQTFA